MTGLRPGLNEELYAITPSMVTLSNGHSFEFMAASGALAFDGRGWPWEKPLRWIGLLKPDLFTIVVKSLTLKPRKGNLRLWKPFGCVRLIRKGTVNAVGLTNPGIDWWVREVYPGVARATEQGGGLRGLDRRRRFAGIYGDGDSSPRLYGAESVRDQRLLSQFARRAGSKFGKSDRLREGGEICLEVTADLKTFLHA